MTEFVTLKLAFRSVVVNVRSASALLRASKSTSEGELARVGTWPDGGLTESNGKTR